MKTTQEFFSYLKSDDLLETNEHGYTKEENLLFDLGLDCTFFDDKEEYQLEIKRGFKDWLNDRGLSVALELETINGRVAVISR